VGSPLLDETRAILIRCMSLYMPCQETVLKQAARGDKPKGTESQTNPSSAHRSNSSQST
jgi:hypothetical protein